MAGTIQNGHKHLQVAEKEMKKWAHAISIKECWQINLLGTKESISDDNSHSDRPGVMSLLLERG